MLYPYDKEQTGARMNVRQSVRNQIGDSKK